MSSAAAGKIIRHGRRSFRRSARKRVRWIMQMESADCGAACLAMVLAAHGRRVSMEGLRGEIGAGRDGASAQDLAAAGAAHGLTVRSFSVDRPEALRSLPLPAIAHWEGRHFVVIERVGETSCRIVDPSLGARTLTFEEIRESLSGTVLTFAPGPAFERIERSGLALPRYLKHVLKESRLLAAVLALSLALQALGLLMPLATAAIVDRIIPARSAGILGTFAAGAVALVLFQALAGLARQLTLVKLQSRLDRGLMTEFMTHLFSLPYRFFQCRSTGDLLMRANSNTLVREVFSSQVMSTALDGFLVSLYLVLLLLLHPPLAALTAAIGLIQVLSSYVASRKLAGLVQREISVQSKYHGYLVEALRGIATIKAAGAEREVLDEWRRLFGDYIASSMKRERMASVLSSATGSLATAAPLALLISGTAFVLSGRLTLGSMLAFNALAAGFLAPLASLVASLERLISAGAYLSRLEDVFESAPETGREGSDNPTHRLQGRVSARDLSFRYARNAPLVLRDINVDIQPGQFVALVGPSGSGKSTLARLLTGLYEPTTGAVLFDGLSAGDLNKNALRRQMGVVLQDAFLFQDTIRKNISFARPGLALEQVRRAARLAAIDQEIELMPLGYETLLSEVGDNVSGGQRQRLCLARALAHEPAVLVLDEATSELDTQTEAAVQKNLAALCCTRIVIAHRLSTVRDADQILVLDGGRIVERGGHEELVAAGGLYARLVERQSGPSRRPASRRQSASRPDIEACERPRLSPDRVNTNTAAAAGGSSGNN